jgi:transcriptional regulator with XRE-family HTH domain
MRQRVSENVKVLMARRGVRQPQIMAILGMSQAAVSRRLNGQHPWDIDELERISEAFEVPVTELVWAPQSPRPDQPNEGPQVTSSSGRRPVWLSMVEVEAA